MSLWADLRDAIRKAILLEERVERLIVDGTSMQAESFSRGSGNLAQSHWIRACIAACPSVTEARAVAPRR